MNASLNLLNEGPSSKKSAVIVPSHRLKWDVYFRYLNVCSVAGKKAKTAEELNIVTLNEFMEDLLFRSMSPKALLTYSQELLLVKRILDGADTSVLSSIGLARNVSHAAKYVKEYCLSEDSEYYLSTSESRLFHEWLGKLDTLKRKLSLISAYDLPIESAGVVKNSNLDIPEYISLVGFIHQTPAVKELFGACEERGTKIDSEDLIAFDLNKIRTISFTNVSDEVLYCAKWVKQVISSLSNGQVVTVAVPSIDDYREAINETFSAILPYEDEPIWDIGGGLSLLSYPEAQALIDTLSIDLMDNDVELIQRVINSEFIQLGLSRHEAGVFMTRIRSLRKVTINLADILEELAYLAKGNSNFTQALEKLTRLQEMLLSHNEAINISSWGLAFADIADAMGWMEGAYDDPLKERIASDLLEFRSMSRFTTDITKGPAVAWLREHFQLLRFSYPRNNPSLVHVVSYGDALGTLSKAAWVIGLSSDVMPGDLQSNSLVPYSLQQVSEMPTRNWDAYYEHAKTRMESLLSIAPMVVASFSERNDKGLKMTPCTINGLFADYKKLESKHRLTNETVKLATLDMLDDTLPAISTSELSQLTGTAGFLDNFRESPFNASFKRRYKVYEIETEVGLSYGNQGDVLHMAMDLFWEKYPSRADLVETTDTQLAVSMGEFVKSAVKAYRIEKLYGPVICGLEVKQTTAIAMSYVAMIKNSSLEYKVLAGEHTAKMDIKGLKFNLRIDQVLSEGGQTIVNDFKRSVRYQVNWMKNGRNPDSLQLPLYVAYTDFNGVAYKGAALSVAHQDNVSFNSMGTPEACGAMDDKEWSKLVDGYHGLIEGLVGNFIDGGEAVHNVGRYFPSEFEARIANLGNIGL